MAKIKNSLINDLIIDKNNNDPCFNKTKYIYINPRFLMKFLAYNITTKPFFNDKKKLSVTLISYRIISKVNTFYYGTQMEFVE